uniref:LOB domain-containing protein n=1 Tax=Physcomitrium patens TaxID=3218 RepID=A0A2K1JJ48_PHYPA|nr:hypothetical protein PHYPA_018980 [Physcomitrium patens]
MHSYRRLRMVMVSALGTSACAACRVLRRKCTAQCLFAPFFPPDQPQKFAHVHKDGRLGITRLGLLLISQHNPRIIPTRHDANS